MIARVSEKPFWGPEEQIRRFINQHDEARDIFHKVSQDVLVKTLRNILKEFTPEDELEALLIQYKLNYPNQDDKRRVIYELLTDRCPQNIADDEDRVEEFFYDELGKYLPYQQALTQERIKNIDLLFQKQLIWSYDKPPYQAEDAYFYWDWCPIGTGASSSDPRWQISQWYEYQNNLVRAKDRTFDFTKLRGYRNANSGSRDEMVMDYDAESEDQHAEESEDTSDPTTLDKTVLRHNIMRSYLEVSEWLGDGALQYGSHNGFVSRKMSLGWLFCAIRALINWKMQSHDKYAEVDIHPLDVGYMEDGIFKQNSDSNSNPIYEGFLDGKNPQSSTQGKQYDDVESLKQTEGCCDLQEKVRAEHPDRDGILKVRGNEWHYGERAYFYAHTSFIGECRFFHNARFLGQTTFDKEINGTAMRSRWADLAEYKEADRKYDPGTLVMFGGEKELTISDGHTCHAIVTTKPGLVLNADDSILSRNMVGIALVGTVPVKVVGNVRKFDRLVPSRRFKGYAKRKGLLDLFRKPIGIAMSDSTGGLVQCVTRMEF